jgi:nucleoside-diphosphate-sugar epimerase
MRYFLTGATGFVGGRIARQLREAGHDVVALVRTPAKAADLQGLGVTLAAGDVTDKQSMVAPMRGVDGVFHIAGWYKVGAGRRAGAEAQAINVDGTRNVLELMQELGIGRGVYTSTLAINSDTHGKLVDESYRFTGQHISEYDRTKAGAHAVAEQFMAQGLPLVVLMPGLIYGPGDTSSVRTTLLQYLQRKLPAIPQRTAYSWAHVDDIAAVHIKALQEGKGGETYIVAGPTHTLVEALHMAQAITGIPAPRSLPPAVFAAMALLAGLAEPLVTLPDLYTSEGLRVLAGTTYIGDAAKAKRELRYNPRPLAEGMAETLRHEMQLLGITAQPTP